MSCCCDETSTKAMNAACGLGLVSSKILRAIALVQHTKCHAFPNGGFAIYYRGKATTFAFNDETWPHRGHKMGRRTVWTLLDENGKGAGVWSTREQPVAWRRTKQLLKILLDMERDAVTREDAHYRISPRPPGPLSAEVEHLKNRVQELELELQSKRKPRPIVVRVRRRKGVKL